MPVEYPLHHFKKAFQSINLPKITEFRTCLFNAQNDFLYISHWAGLQNCARQLVARAKWLPGKHDCLVSVGANRGDGYGNPGFVFNKTDIVIEFSREFILAGDFCKIGLPPG